jgi:hypothetical protein
MACLRANSEVDTECHWKGVWGLGVKLEMVTLTARCHLPAREDACVRVCVCVCVRDHKGENK